MSVHGPAVAVLQRDTERLDLWPSVRTLAEPNARERWDVDETLRHLGEFTPPDAPQANLGLREGAV